MSTEIDVYVLVAAADMRLSFVAHAVDRPDSRDIVLSSRQQPRL
jgi:hypothetical protein